MKLETAISIIRKMVNNSGGFRVTIHVSRERDIKVEQSVFIRTDEDAKEFKYKLENN